jgi:aminoglycoside 6'-N-acetyltransferase I
MRIRKFEESDFLDWLRMSAALFPEHTTEELAPWMRTFRTREDGEVFIALRDDGSACGFVEVGSRDYADGCDTSPVGFIEAWFVDSDMRRAGVGRALLTAAEDWARDRGYSEMASDALLDNSISHSAHEGSGYIEVERAVRYRKSINRKP